MGLIPSIPSVLYNIISIIPGFTAAFKSYDNQDGTLNVFLWQLYCFRKILNYDEDGRSSVLPKKKITIYPYTVQHRAAEYLEH